MQPMQAVPSEARDILDAVHASPLLLAHLAFVHQVAFELLEGIAAAWPDYPIDRHAVLVGAATHDVGKTRHPEELRGAGRLHENDGPAVLMEHGLPEDLARFARTHAQWAMESSPQTEDLIVALANLLWIGKRNERLEGLIVKRLVEFSGEPEWSVFAKFDEVELAILEGAGQRLAIYKQVEADEDRK
jgi:hypothetical protein